MRNKQQNRASRTQREQIESSQFAYSESLYSNSEETQPVGFLIPITKRIERQIYDEIYKEKNSKIFNSVGPFEMILTKPTKKFVFQTANGIFKGRFQCKNPRCTQEKRKKDPPTQKPYQEPKKQEQTQGKRQHKQSANLTQKQSANLTQQQTLLQHEAKEEDEKSRKQYRSWCEWWKSTRTSKAETRKQENSKMEQTKDETGVKLQDEEMPPGRENTRWSSSISYVTIHYSTFPVPLKDFKKCFQRNKHKKLQIYFFISVLGQKCRKCESQEFIQPEYGQREMERIRKNFFTYIYNQIYGAEGGFKTSKLRRLRKHEEDYCEACFRGICGKDDLK